MFNREFTFTDFKGNEKKATYWFSLEKDEMLKLELGNYGGLQYAMTQMVKDERPDKVLDMLEKIVLSAVGEISPDGASFYKSDKISDAFRQTKVFHDLLFELLTEPEGLRNFILGAIPAEASAKILEEEAKGTETEGNVVALPSTTDNAGN